MTSTMGGDDPAHDLPDAEKDNLERKLREAARRLLGAKSKKERNRKINQANEISRKKSGRAHQGAD